MKNIIIIRNPLFVVIRVVSALILFIAIAELPYGYYRFVRIFTFAVCGYSFFKAYTLKNKIFTWIFGIIAFVFNPIYPLYLGKELWQIVDVISGIAILTSIFFFDSKKINFTIKKKITYIIIISVFLFIISQVLTGIIEKPSTRREGTRRASSRRESTRRN